MSSLESKEPHLTRGVQGVLAITLAYLAAAVIALTGRGSDSATE